MEATNEHRAPWACVYAKDEGDNCLPGDAPATDREYFEVLCLCLLQAGLNWSSVRKHWAKYREGFLGFDVDALARASAEEVLARPGVIRNARKVGAVVENAREVRRLAAEHGSFGAFLETLWPLSGAERVRALTARFRQVGPETADYFLHSVGLVG